MSARKAARRPKAPSFFTLDETGIPLGALPEPLPCPFCGQREIQITREEVHPEGPLHGRTAQGECGKCGARSGWCPQNDEFPDAPSMIAEAARMWNQRKGGAA